MVVIGIDAHKRTHTAVAVDGNGAELGMVTVAANSAGHLELLRWAQGLDSERRFAAEDCRHLTRGLERDLLGASEVLVRVPPKLMAGVRRSARTRGKSDPIDGLAVARAALREPELPTARLDGVEREVRLLLDHREDLIAQRTRAINRLRWHLHGLDPALEAGAGRLTTLRALDALAERLGTLQGVVAEIALELVEDCRGSTVKAKRLERQIAAKVAPLAPSLIALPGCGALSAAKLVAETADVRRFKSADAFARHNGTAPIPVWSGNDDHHRLNRGGNRQLNAAIHRIAITQLRSPGPTRDAYEQLTKAGKTKRDALRIIRRRLSNIVYKRMLDDSRSAGSESGLALAA
jgi:transposase